MPDCADTRPTGRRNPIPRTPTHRLLDRDFYRNGPDHRGGKEVGFAEVKRRFGLRTVTIGRWVTKAEQASTANHFYDALADLQLLLHGPADLLSLRGFTIANLWPGRPAGRGSPL